jgi:hypothetical protein
MVRDVLAAARPASWLPDFAVDTTVWTRCDAECSPQRGFYYHPSRHCAGQPIVAGWCYCWLVGLSAGADSWTAPLDGRRLLVGDNPNLVAAQQIRQVLPRLGPLPVAALVAFDGGYDPGQLSVELAGTGVQIVVRVRNDRKYFARPAPRAPGQKGTRRRHGARFTCADPTTWPEPDRRLEVDDDGYGRVEVAAWQRLHPHQRTYREPGGAMTVLAGPRGEIAGRAYKTNAEANVFRRGRREHVIETPIGRIGIGICADNQFAAQLQLMHDLRVDLVLMPHAWPTPARAAGLVSAADVAGQQRRMVDLPSLYARSLGVPVVFVNQIGPLAPIGGILGRLMNPTIWRLRGQSRIVDSDGALLGALAEQEGILTAAASLDPSRRRYLPQPSYGGWLQPGSALARKLIIPLDILTGRLSYTISPERRVKAQACAAETAEVTVSVHGGAA